MIRISYGISNFKKLVTEGYYYVDRTQYIALLESLGEQYITFLRPRRFGKSLFVSILQHYYGLEYKEDFDTIFGKSIIGRQPTPLANSYMTLTFDFSGINTDTPETTYSGFLDNVRVGISMFCSRYSDYFSKQEREQLLAYSAPEQIIKFLFATVQQKNIAQKIYLLIDEYDHFANELIAFHFDNFKTMVSGNGFVRKFYEELKKGAGAGVIDRMFITGVSPVTLDSLTSGFNIGTNLTTDVDFNKMFGFVEGEVADILKGIEVPEEQMDKTLNDMQQWYDGYRFHKDAAERMYNPDMVLYLAKDYARLRRYPDDLLDTNIASDYSKVRRIFKIGDQEPQSIEILNDLLEEGQVSSTLTRQYSFERAFTRADLISLLFYNGIITIKEGDLAGIAFAIPNYVIKQLYYQYLYQLSVEQGQLDTMRVNTVTIVNALARHADFGPIIALMQDILTALSTRDKRQFSEKHLKAVFTSILFTSGIYTIHNEFEVQKNETEKGYVDLLLIRRPPYDPPYQHVIEFKYLPKEKVDKLPEVKEEASAQLQAYIHNDNYLRTLDQLSAHVVIFAGNEGESETVRG